MHRILWPLLLLLGAPAAWAGCKFEDGYAKSQSSISIDNTLMVPRDAPLGSELFDSGWKIASGPHIKCSGGGNVSGRHSGNFGAVVQGVPGNREGSVLATNVPGVGIQALWCNEGVCTTNHMDLDPPTSINWTVNAFSYHLKSSSWWVRLVKTGPVDPGTHTFNGTVTIRYIDLDVAELNVHGTIDSGTLACQLETPNLVVQLPSVTVGELHSGRELPGKQFEAALKCDPGIRLSYQIDALHPSAVADVMANDSGPGMATDVGVRLYRDGPGGMEVVPLSKRVLHTVSTQDGALHIPLIARYYKLGEHVSSGNLSTTANLVLSYE
ncbi:fimbrial protein [Metapseudomonas boanensis]|uniref:Fimbrial protein n=1 Tax=Metapseudomonas boanensis TaxID=2822138 RepID=A0ABS5XCI3_9GAMM|nr:fimbrial protein [Pseudomonas boanensis]MBT8765399.1 fimbrial protein [Pseudomonas boanensis]